MIKPLGDRIVIQPKKPEEMTSSGIVLPETAKEKQMEGKVIAVGPGRHKNGQHISPDVKEGEIVLFSKFAGTEVKVNGEEFLIVNESDILAVVDGTELSENNDAAASSA